MKVLIANRGEIARRIERTCFRLGHDAVGIWVEGDSGSEHALQHSKTVSVPSYLDQVAIVEAAHSSDATAVHPGFGFLAENADFANAVIAAGLTWVGPRPEVVAQMGSKIHAREIAEAAGVPLIPGFADSQDDDALAAAAERIGFPVLVKASAGGGGKGIRIARSAEDFAGALTEARAEADRSFGDDAVIVERYIERPRHVEVQVIGDRHGNVYHLGTRECSVQRRYQKLFEEAPAPNLPDATRAGLHEAAVRLAAAVDYDSAGTVEFIVDDETGDYFFLEMNTRLQVEHPVTEEVLGLDLIELMFQVAQGDELPDLSQVEPSGHSIEARITAERADAGFIPAVGTVRLLDVPPDVRWESALEVGVDVTPDYDAMIAKLVVHGSDRADALARLRFALNHLIIAGLETTTGFHYWLTDQPEIVDGRVTTRFLDEIDPPAMPDMNPVAAVRLLEALNRGEEVSVWGSVDGFSLTPHGSAHVQGVRDASGELHEVVLGPDDRASAPPIDGWTASVDNQAVAFTAEGHTQFFESVPRTELWAAGASGRSGTGAALMAPFPAAVTEVHVSPGDEVVGDQVLVVIEAMKMLHSLKADGAATVEDVLVSVGDQVTTAQPLVTFADSAEDGEATD
ncbi:MAG: biotin carboxylase N-terminal domain-containing protein [Actinomycetota bacterium]